MNVWKRNWYCYSAWGLSFFIHTLFFCSLLRARRFLSPLSSHSFSVSLIPWDSSEAVSSKPDFSSERGVSTPKKKRRKEESEGMQKRDLVKKVMVSKEGAVDSDKGELRKRSERGGNLQTYSLAQARESFLLSQGYVEAVYPRKSILRREEGVVHLKLVVERGVLKEVLVHKSSAFPLLDAAAVSAVEKWRFRDLTMSFIQIFRFQLRVGS